MRAITFLLFEVFFTVIFGGDLSISYAADSTTVEIARTEAEHGDPVAQIKLGGMYYTGQGVKQDYSEALKWYRKAAEQGLATPQDGLGVMYRDGQGVAQDYAEAMKWFRKSADQGFMEAQFNLGAMYHNGQGVPPNDAEAVKWWRMAAAQGYPLAQSTLKAMGANLNVKNDNAPGVKQDNEPALNSTHTDMSTPLGSAYYECIKYHAQIEPRPAVFNAETLEQYTKRVSLKCPVFAATAECQMRTGASRQDCFEGLAKVSYDVVLHEK